MNISAKNNSIYIVSFFEGAAVMVTELCGSKLLSPFFGSSLFVWAAVIAVTLGSLAAGYFYGGQLSTSENKSQRLVLLLLSASVFMGFMPIISNVFPFLATTFPLLAAVVISALLLLLVPMLMMGAASPVIISIKAQQGIDSGKVSGTVYSISTIGGIVSTFIAGFYFIPEFGINSTLIVFAILLVISLLLLQKKNNLFTIVVVFAVLLLFGFSSRTPLKNCIYQKDGLLGKLNVIDDTIIVNNQIKVIRKLLVNNVVQTEMNSVSKKSVSKYIQIIDSNISSYPGGKALVLGLGGGLTSGLFAEKGYLVTGVEFDQRIVDVARNYFFLDNKIVSVNDDARHFLYTSETIYDLILMDLFKAEEQPVHVITLESFEMIKKHLNKNGTLIINWHGYLKGEKGLGTCILLNTLKKAGFNYQLCAESNNEDERNIVLFASIVTHPICKYKINEAIPSTTLINTDNRPLLEKYNALANQNWRKNYIQYYYSGI